VARLSHARLVQALSVEIHQVAVAANAALTMLIGNCVLALILAPAAGAAAIGFAVIGALVSRPFLARARRLGRTITEANFGVTEGAMAFLAGLKLATAQGLQATFVAEHRRAADTAMADRLQFLALQTRLRNITTILAAAVAAATLFVGVTVFRLEPSVLIALLLVLSRMTAPALMLQQGAQQLMHSLPSYDVVRALRAELAATAAAPAASGLAASDASGPIVLDRVSFSHPSAAGRAAGIRSLSLLIPEGAFVGVAGPSGSGKTTFLDLIAGVLEPDGGIILAQGRELYGPALAAHRRGLAYVAQEPVLFDATVRRNLTWSQPSASDEEVWRALEMTGAAQLLQGLDGGLDARVGERGGLLSAGERQRLALARALLRRPRLLLLDEATNAIDIEGERRILERLAALRPRTTIMMAAHRPESLALCDHILEFPGPRFTQAPVRESAA
jgi:ABC-type multidrug transport system fused ATPase/permease subunit